MDITQIIHNESFKQLIIVLLWTKTVEFTLTTQQRRIIIIKEGTRKWLISQYVKMPQIKQIYQKSSFCTLISHNINQVIKYLIIQISTVSTAINLQDDQLLNNLFQDNQSQYCDTYTKALIGHQQQTNFNSSQQHMVLLAKSSNGQGNQIIRLENILTDLGIEFQKNNESISLNLPLFEKWIDKIEEQFFHSYQESVIL